MSHVFAKGSLTVSHPWMYATACDTALIFMQIHNTAAKQAMILGAEMAWAGAAGFVDLSPSNTGPARNRLAGLPVPPGENLVLAPEGTAIEATHLTRAFSQGEYGTMVLLSSLGPLEIKVLAVSHDTGQGASCESRK